MRMTQRQQPVSGGKVITGYPGQRTGHPRERWLSEQAIVSVIGFVIAAEILAAIIGFNLYFQARVASPATTPLPPTTLVLVLAGLTPIVTILGVRLLIAIKRAVQVLIWRLR